MAKNSIRDYSATNSSNTDIQSIDISEGCSPAGINNAIREVMADLKDVSTGAVALESPAFDSASLTGDLTFGDNDKVIFGAGSDLQIYHDGSNSYVKDAGTGDLYLQGSNNVQIESAAGANMIYATAGAQVRLFYNASPKFETTNTGVDVTGTVTLSGSDGKIYLPQTPSTYNWIGDSIEQTGIVIVPTNDGTSERLSFATNNAERMRITSAGEVLVGTTDTSVYNNVTGTGVVIEINSIQVARSGGPTLLLNRQSSDGEIQRFLKNGSTVGSITVTASSTAYNTSSDYRLKENVVADWDATTRLKQLNPVRFNFIADPDTTVDGFLAHEVQDIVPEAITGTKDAMRDEEYEVSAATGDIYTPAIDAVLDEDGNEVTPAVAEVIHSTDVERPEELAEGQQWRETTPAVMGTRSVPDYQGIDQSKLVPLLVKTIQELEARITALEAN